ncbi:MAG TPA: PAS domain S-box protein [Chitinophagaceae bacterium]|nr:PAS domain S-box protein [Chitinophagaceae bacterium]
MPDISLTPPPSPSYNGEKIANHFSFALGSLGRDVFENIPAALYTCDTAGRITMYNKAAVELWGRAPQIGKDLWCGSWKIFHPDGITLMDFEDCPMAITLREARPVNDQEIVIQRPDGSFRNIQPNPVPLFDEEGNLKGALNMLVDITDRKSADEKIAILAAIVRSSDDAIVSKSLDGVVTSWNAAAERIFGYKAEEMIGQLITKIIPENRLQEEPNLLGKLKNGERVEHFETQRRTRDGRLKDISLSVSPIKDKSARVIGASKIARDVTEQKINELMLKTISSVSPVGLWMTDTTGNNIFVNDTWLSWTGIPLENQKGAGWMDAVMPEDKAAAYEKFNMALLGRENYSTKFRIHKNGEQVRWCFTEGSPYFDRNGEFAGYAGSVTDITEMKKLEDRKDDFIKMASHELKTPITSIKGYVQLLQAIYEEMNEEKFKNSRQTVKTSLHTISKQVNKLTRLVSELLDLSRIESGRLDLHKKEFDLGDLVEETVQDVQLTTARHAIIVHNDFEGMFYGDRDRIGQVLTNLLANAVKYSPDADHIEMTVNNDGNTSVVKIRDFGIGIDPEDQPRIFERFYRVEGKSEQTFPGFGIGLFIAREIVQRHGGTISVESKKGNGSVFTIVFPSDQRRQS